MNEEKNDPAKTTSADGYWWLAAIVALVGSIGVGVLICLALQPQQSDWFGVRYFLALGGSFLVGSILSAAAMIVSIIRGERRAVWGAIAGIIGLAYVVYIAGELIKDKLATSEYRKNWSAQVVETTKLTEAAMMSNPNTPLDLVEKVAASRTLMTGAVEPARHALKKRRPDKETERPAESPAPAAPTAG